MLVKNWMAKPVITIDKSETIGVANQLMSKNEIRALPVLSEGKLVGIVTDRDLKKVYVSAATGIEAPKLAYLNTRVKVGHIMTKDPTTVKPESTVDEVARILRKYKISGVPVVDDQGIPVGMITNSDILGLLITLSGTEAPGIQIAVEIKDVAGSVREVADLIRSVNGRIRNLLTSYEDVPDGFRHAYFKTENIPPERIDELVEKLNAKVKILYIIEHFQDEIKPRKLLMNI